MEFKIKKEPLRSGLRNCYEVIIDFMFGDADGSEDIRFYISDEQYNDLEYRNKLFDFIKHIQSCITIDIHGRQGLESEKDLNEWYHLGIDYQKRFEPAYKWNIYCENSIDCDADSETQTLQFNSLDTDFVYSIPTDTYGWYASYDGLEIVHYGDNGDISEVEIIENDN